MTDYTSISPAAFDGVFDRIGKQWMLITAKGKDENGREVTNTMTASWGGMGILWNKPVCFCFIRPQRYTYPLTEGAERFSLSFLGEEYRGALRFCGSKSGRDVNKWQETGLSHKEYEGVPFVEQAEVALICKKLYADTLKKEGFCLPNLLENYKADDFHRVYVLEIEEVLKKN